MKKIKAKFEKMDALKGAITRRNFLQSALKTFGAIAAIELGGAGLLFLRSHTLEGEFGGIITVGAVEEFIKGSVVEYEEGNFFLVRNKEGGFLSVYRRCPHLGCTVKWVAEKEKFYCPCHSASFDPNGDFQNQIVTRALDTFPVSVENGMVKVDTSQIIMREKYKPEDIVYENQR